MLIDIAVQISILGARVSPGHNAPYLPRIRLQQVAAVPLWPTIGSSALVSLVVGARRELGAVGRARGTARCADERAASADMQFRARQLMQLLPRSDNFHRSFVRSRIRGTQTQLAQLMSQNVAEHRCARGRAVRRPATDAPCPATCDHCPPGLRAAYPRLRRGPRFKVLVHVVDDDAACACRADVRISRPDDLTTTRGDTPTATVAARVRVHFSVLRFRAHPGGYLGFCGHSGGRVREGPAWSARADSCTKNNQVSSPQHIVRHVLPLSSSLPWQYSRHGTFVGHIRSIRRLHPHSVEKTTIVINSRCHISCQNVLER